MLAMSGAPGYEQKELRSNGEHVSAVLRMERAELFLTGNRIGRKDKIILAFCVKMC